MTPPDHGFSAPRQGSAPNRSIFRVTVVNCATHRVTQQRVRFLRFEGLLAAKAREIGVKFTSKTPIGGSDFLRRGFGGQVKNKIAILFHTARPILFFAAAIATATPAAIPLFSAIAPYQSSRQSLS